ncbi:MAG: hypothetical protein LBL70_06070 [Treponema sp.]|jgi:hypothetical protein|nr:hypothetical protein [Treponema sp.]
MGLFLENGKTKSTVFLNAFMLSLGYIGVYVLVFIQSNRLVPLLPESTENVLLVWLPPAALSLFASFICAVPAFFVSNYKSITISFLLIGVYAALIAVLLFSRASEESRGLIIYPLVFYLVFPALFGNLVCHGVIKLRKKAGRIKGAAEKEPCGR